MAAIKQMTRMAHRQAEVLALGDVFLSLTVLFLALVGLTLFMRKPAMRAGGGGGH
jgi:DHA2 family multidrug resistance protein